MIGDIGGLHDAMILIFQFIVTIVTGSIFQIHSVQNLFAINKYAFKAKFKPKITQK